MDDDVDYESLGGKYPMSVNAVAGAIAGYFEVKYSHIYTPEKDIE